jgi:hypothetical protein
MLLLRERPLTKVTVEARDAEIVTNLDFKELRETVLAKDAEMVL